MRDFLLSFKLPGEGPVIGKILEAFSEVYNKQNPGVLKNADHVFMLSYAVLQLNTDLHNPNVKIKMSPEQFIKGFRETVRDNEFEILLQKTKKETIEKGEKFDSTEFRNNNVAEFKKTFPETFSKTEYPALLNKLYNEIRSDEIKLKTQATVTPESSPESPDSAARHRKP